MEVDAQTQGHITGGTHWGSWASCVHLLLFATAITVFGVHLGSWLGIILPWRLWWPSFVSPCFTRQTHKLASLAALGLGSPLACQHLSWTSALDLALLVVQFVAQEVKGGVPVDDVALAVPLDLCFSFLLLGVAQGRIELHFSWVLANLVMSFSVSSIPLVFGHKQPSAVSQDQSTSEQAHAGRRAGLSRNSSGNDRSTVNGPSTVTDSSAFNSRRSSLHMSSHLTAAHLESLVQSQGGYSKPRHSQCGSSTSSVVEQLQACHTPRMTAKPVHKLDRVTLPTDANQQDPTSALIMRSNGMAVELLDKHGRSMHYTSRVRRQRVYIKTGVGGIKDARLQQLLPRLQHTLLNNPVQPQPQQQSQPQAPGSPGLQNPVNGSRLAQLISNKQAAARGSSTLGSPSPQSSAAAQPEDTSAASAVPGAAGSENTISASAKSGTAPAPGGTDCQNTGGSQSGNSVGRESQPILSDVAPSAQPESPPASTQHQPAQQQADLAQQQPQHDCNLEHETQAYSQQQQQLQHCSKQGGGRQQQLLGPPSLLPSQKEQQQQQQQHSSKDHAPHSHHQARHPQRPLFGGVYVRDGCVEMTLDLLTFMPPLPQTLAAPSSSTSPLTNAQGVPDEGTSSRSCSQHSQWLPQHPGSWLDIMGLSHRLPPVYSQHAPCSSPDKLHRASARVGGALDSMPQQQQQQQQQEWTAGQRALCLRSHHPAQPILASGRASSGSNTGDAAHCDPYLKLQLGEGEAVRTWRHQPCLHVIPPSPHLNASPPPATRAGQGVCGGGDPEDAGALAAELGDPQEPLSHLQQRGWHLELPTPPQQQGLHPEEQCQDAASYGNSSLNSCCPHTGEQGASPAAQLLGVYPHVVVAKHLGCSDSSRRSNAALAPPPHGTAGAQPGPMQEPACPRVHLYVLLPDTYAASGRVYYAQQQQQQQQQEQQGGMQSTKQQRQQQGGLHSTMQQQQQQQQQGGLHSIMQQQQPGMRSVPVTARHQGCYLHVRVLSSRVCPLKTGSGPAAADAACEAPGMPALVALEVELAAHLCPGLVHFEVCMPGMDAPSASACMLVVGQDCASLAAELQQLQPGCEAQARQQAAALGRELVQRRYKRRQLQEQQQQQTGSPEAVLAVNPLDQLLPSSDSSSMKDACPCADNDETGLRASPDLPLLPAATSAQALVHDFGVWLQLEGAAKAAAAPDLRSPTFEANPHLYHPHLPHPHLQHALGPSALPCTAPGSADLSAHFLQGMAHVNAQVASEVCSLRHHLADTADRMGWTHMACHLRASQCSSLNSRHASVIPLTQTSVDHSRSHKSPHSVPCSLSRYATQQPCSTHVRASQRSLAGYPTTEQQKQSMRAPHPNFFSPAVAAVSPAFAAFTASAAGQLANCAHSSASAVAAATFTLPAAAAMAAAIVA